MAITKGHQVECCDRNRRGGLKNIWLIEQGNVTATAVTAGVVTAFTTNDAYQFDFDRGTAGFTANATRENGSTIITIELEFYIPKVTQEVNENLDQLARSCGLFAIVESYADDCVSPVASTYKFVLGYDEIFELTAYMEFMSGEQTTGVGLQDANGTLIKIGGEQGEYPLEISATMTAGSTYTDAWTVA